MTFATYYLGAMAEGYCLPQLFKCEDGQCYVVKFMSNPQGIRGLVNELIAYRLGKLLDLPVVPGRIVYLTEDFIRQIPELSKQGVQPGPHFGSLFVEHAQEPEIGTIAKCMNLDQVAGMIVFDHWIENDDRDTGNVILTAEDAPKFYMIDHESCFCGSGWYGKKLLRHRNQVKPYWSDVYERFAPYLDQFENSFLTAVGRLEGLSGLDVREAMQDIPEEWDIEPEELDILVIYLERRKRLVRDVVLKLKQHFPQSMTSQTKKVSR
jgi:hypothetical protein